MSLELEKSMRIINDLVSFCYYEGAEKISMEWKNLGGKSMQMEVSCAIENLEQKKLEQIRRVLRLPRQHEVEQLYWELSGETEFSGELSLVAAMSDAAEVTYEKGILTIVICRDD